jgi:hypothetical protein
MKSLLCHEFYQQIGREDPSFLEEAAQLRAHAHQVVQYTRHNDEIDGDNRVGVAARSIWNKAGYRELRELIRRERPDIMHCTNISSMISPSARQAAREKRAGGSGAICPCHSFERRVQSAQADIDAKLNP